MEVLCWFVYRVVRLGLPLTCVTDVVKYGISNLTVMDGLPSLSSGGDMTETVSDQYTRMRRSLPELYFR